MKQDPIRYYQEPNGDYLAVEPATGHYSGAQGRLLYDGRAAALAGVVSSVCSTSVTRDYLQGCTRVRKDAVPPEWLAAIGYHRPGKQRRRVQA